MSSTPDHLPPLLSAELARQYDILHQLGAGGMGTVWLARERSLERLVAIKVLAGESINAGNVRERFRREARVAARLLHPNIVPLFAFGETADALYFAMGYVEGESLAAKLEREGRLPRAVAMQILDDISDALAFAHREGVVHRDVKPENILLDAKTGRALLADFGIARVADAGATSVTMTGVAVGTPSYMSPEQAVGSRDVDGRSDVYSLGVVGYRMLLGRLPFTGGGAQAIMAQHAAAKPADLALAVPAADRELAHLVMRALEKEPGDRWASADDLRDALRALARDGGSLPEGLERVEMVGTKFLAADLLICGVFAGAWVWDTTFRSDPVVWKIMPLNLALLPALGLLWAIPTAKRFGWRETLRAMLLPPKGWAHWWPRALRRADDVWDRLPRSLRRLRNVIDGVVTYFVLDIASFLVVATTGGGAYGDWLLSVMGTDSGLWALGMLTKALPLGWIAYEFVRTRRQLGLTTRELGDLLGIPHVASHPAWLKPKFARLLGSDPGAVSAPRAPQTPDELASAIKALAGRLIDAGLLADEHIADAAESVRAAIAVLETEIRRLHAELDPAEGERLARRIATLGASADDVELRKLLEGQQALLLRLDERRSSKEARRERLRAQLTTLWMHLLEIETRASRGAAADPELTARVRALSHELSHLGQAMDEVSQMLRPAPTLEVTPR